MLSHDSSDSDDDSILHFESGLARKKSKMAPPPQTASATASSSRSMDGDASPLDCSSKRQGPISSKAHVGIGTTPIVNPYAKTPPASSAAVHNPYLQKRSSSSASSQASTTSTPVNRYGKQAPSIRLENPLHPLSLEPLRLRMPQHPVFLRNQFRIQHSCPIPNCIRISEPSTFFPFGNMPGP